MRQFDFHTERHRRPDRFQHARFFGLAVDAQRTAQPQVDEVLLFVALERERLVHDLQRLQGGRESGELLAGRISAVAAAAAVHVGRRPHERLSDEDAQQFVQEVRGVAQQVLQADEHLEEQHVPLLLDGRELLDLEAQVARRRLDHGRREQHAAHRGPHPGVDDQHALASAESNLHGATSITFVVARPPRGVARQRRRYQAAAVAKVVAVVVDVGRNLDLVALEARRRQRRGETVPDVLAPLRVRDPFKIAQRRDQGRNRAKRRIAIVGQRSQERRDRFGPFVVYVTIDAAAAANRRQLAVVRHEALDDVYVLKAERYIDPTIRVSEVAVRRSLVLRRQLQGRRNEPELARHRVAREGRPVVRHRPLRRDGGVHGARPVWKSTSELGYLRRPS